MKLSQFKKELKEVGLDYKTVANLFDSEWESYYYHLLDLIDDKDSAAQVLEHAFNWDQGPGKYEYWEEKYNKLYYIAQRKEKLEQFKRLAKELGYKVIG